MTDVRDPDVRAADTADRSDRALAVVALLLAALAIWATVATGKNARGAPGDEVWEQAAALVRREFQPGDLITFAPEWIDPVGRLHLGDKLSLDDAARLDAARYPRVWVLSIRGADSPDVAGEAPAWRRQLGGDHGVTVRRYDRTPAVILDDAAHALATAETSGQPARPIASTIAEVGFAPRRCVLAAPLPGGAVTVRFPRFRLGKTLAGAVGLADVFTRRDVREPGFLEVQVGGPGAEKTLAKVRAGVDDGWVRFAAETAPGTAELTVIASAPSPAARDRLICFQLESRR